MQQYEYNKTITTVRELKQYIGKPIYLYYTFGEMGMGNSETRNNIYYAWIKQLTEIPRRWNGECYEDSHTVAGVPVKGLNTLQMITKNGENIAFVHFDDDRIPKTSDAQMHVRTLTKEEFKLYRNKTRLRRYGYTSNS